MNGKVIDIVDTYKHLGLIRNSKLNDNAELITERIQLARNTANSLIGAGLHGLNGVNPEISVTLRNLYYYSSDTTIWSRMHPVVKNR